MPYVEWTPDMGEISGFGGSYEEGCRRMVKDGVEFWEAQDAAFDPHYRGYEGVYGILSDDNDDARALDTAMIASDLVKDGGATGAMHQAAVGHIFAFRRLGADKYCAELREHEKAGSR